MILCILKGKMPFKMHKIIFFREKKKCAYPTLNIQTHYPKHTYFFIWPKYTEQISLSNFINFNRKKMEIQISWLSKPPDKDPWIRIHLVFHRERNPD